MNRRKLLAQAGALAAACVPGFAAPLISQRPSARVIVDLIAKLRLHAAPAQP